MSSFDLSGFGDQLKEVVQASTGVGVSFAKKSLKLNTEEDALEVVKAIKACSNLEYLELEGNTLGPLAAKAVAEALKEKGSVLKRALWKDMFTGRLKTEIPKSLEYLGTALCIAGTRLVELDLSDNALGPIGIEGLKAFLTSSSCYTLKELKLNNSGLGIGGSKMLSKALLDCHENSSTGGTPSFALKVFVAGRNRIENEGAEALASVFKTLTTLEEVSMPQNSIYYAGIQALAGGLSANPGLRVLNLNDNTVGHKGAIALAKALPNFRNLEQLNLGDCLLKTKGSLVLAEALGVSGNHPLLADINLSGNEIRTSGASSIARAMADKMLLTSLQLNGNAFGKEGCNILRKSLELYEKIESLSTLSDDETDDESESDEEDEEEEDEEEDEEDREEEEEDDDDDEKIQEKEVENGVKEVKDVKAQPKILIADFLKSPSGEKLLFLQNDNVLNFVEYAKSTSGTDRQQELKFIEEFTRIIMKVSAFCGSGYGDVRVKAEYLTDSLYSKLCSLAVENDQISVWSNALLVNLGLIKSEHKHNRKIDWNLEGCFKALEKVCHRDYFLPEIRNTLKFFLEKPVKINRAKVVDPFQDSKDSLRTVLDRIQTT